MLYQTENPHGGDIYSDNIRIDFSASLNPLGTPESIKAAMRKAIDSSEPYPDPIAEKLYSQSALTNRFPLNIFSWGTAQRN